MRSHQISDKILQSEPANKDSLGHSEEKQFVLVVLSFNLVEIGLIATRCLSILTWNSGMVERISIQMEASRNSEETITRIFTKELI